MFIISALIVLAIIIFIIKVKMFNIKTHYTFEKRMKEHTKKLIAVINSHEHDVHTPEGFDCAKRHTLTWIKTHSDKLPLAKQQEVEDAIAIGLVSYADLILLHNYILDVEEAREFIFFRHEQKPVVDEYLRLEFIPITDFE